MANLSFILKLPQFAFPWTELPDSLDTLTTLAAQLQTVIGAAISHPVWAIAAVLFTIVLIQITADLVKRVLKTSLAFVLKLPLVLSQWLWKKVTAPAQPSQAAQVDQLLARLDILRQEQDQVVVELKTLLSSTPSSSISPSSAPSSFEQKRSESENALVVYPTATVEDKSSSIVSPETG